MTRNRDRLGADAAAAAVVIARIHGEDDPDERTALALQRQGFFVGEELADLARLALTGTGRDVELYVKRLAHRYDGTMLGVTLAGLVPPGGTALRDAPTARETSPVDDRLFSAKLLQRYIATAFPKDEYAQPLTIGALVDCFDGALGTHAWFEGDDDPPEAGDGG